MRKNLFWIYLFLSELDILLIGFFMLKGFFVQRYWWYSNEVMLCTLSLFLLFEFFLTASFFDDKLAKRRKYMVGVFFINMCFLVTYWLYF